MSTETKHRILLIEDETAQARLFAEYLARPGLEIEHVPTGAAALAALEARMPHVVLLDLGLPDIEGMELLGRLTAQRVPAAIIVVTARGSVNGAVEAMRRGAADFLVKPFNAERLRVTVANALERVELKTLVETWRDELNRDRFHGFIGRSLPMQAVYRIIESAAGSKATVFITGESGTGKEVCADAIHRQSPRRGRPFVALNCAAIPADLMESEIFGHVRGAFTGAHADREGAASFADGGTLFLDEICELDPNLQTKLLRFIQTGAVQRVGDTQTRKVDNRIICATNRDPAAEVSAGRFREDLFYRLHVIPIHLPPLREREDDVLEIAQALLLDYAGEEGKRFRGFDPKVRAIFSGFAWPGNVRQLQNVIRNIVVLNDGEIVEPPMLPHPLREQAVGAPILGAASIGAPSLSPAAGTPPDVVNGAAIEPLWRVERDAIERAIAQCSGNIPRAAALLEISPSTIYRKRLAWQAEGRA